MIEWTYVIGPFVNWTYMYLVHSYETLIASICLFFCVPLFLSIIIHLRNEETDYKASYSEARASASNVNLH
jgi:ACR3 family arsenite efflux pump ArsB